jgi:uroporphyrinogen decarboxylase
MVKNDILLRALRCEETSRTPVWVMRQAGRYLPEYREVRAQAGSFMAMAKNPELVCEVTLQPLRRFPLDAVIIFSDILTIPDAMGLGLDFVPGVGPTFAHPIQSESDVDKIPSFDVNEDLRYVMDGISTTAKALDKAVPLFGFAGSPWTIMTYMVEGGSSKTYSKAKRMLFDRPDLAHRLLQKVTDSTIDYLNAQIEAGADLVQVFDSWGGVLSPEMFKTFSLPYMQQIVEGVKKQNPTTPVILFSKGVQRSLKALSRTGADGLGVDWTTELKQARKWTKNRVALQGNMDPCVLFASEEVIHKEVKKVIQSNNGKPGHIFNLGHGMQPDMEPEKLACMIEAVREHSQK